MTTATAERADGSKVGFVDRDPFRGYRKDVYFTEDGRHVLAFFRGPLDEAEAGRLGRLAGPCREEVLGGGGGADDLFRWPEALVRHGGRTGLMVPAYGRRFRFDPATPLAGAEKAAKWFASALSFNRFVPPRDKGVLPGHLESCLNLARAVSRLHAAGLAHSSLDHFSCLVDPATGGACLVGLDNLVVPGFAPPPVKGVPGFMAPELMDGPGGQAPGPENDRHALAVLIYLLLLHRHPLRGRKVHSRDPAVQEALELGREALFIEHPVDGSNRPEAVGLGADRLPWADTRRMPLGVMGPHLKELFERAFVGGLRDPGLRPAAADWEAALAKTTDLLQPCPNPGCRMGWHVFPNSKTPACPYCGAGFRGRLPILDFYSSADGGSFRSDDHRLVVHEDRLLLPRHVGPAASPGGVAAAGGEGAPAGHFVSHEGRWFLVNRSLGELRDPDGGPPVPPGRSVELVQGLRLLLGPGPGARLIHVTLLEA
jgi:hypothetical protein